MIMSIKHVKSFHFQGIKGKLSTKNGQKKGIMQYKFKRHSNQSQKNNGLTQE